MELAVEAKNLAKTFRGGVVAVSGLDLAVRAGSVYGLVGRNGAGKTTALRLLAGLVRPDSGEARVLGADLWRARRALRQRVAYVSQGQQLPGWMTLDELERYVSSFYDRWNPRCSGELSRRWGLPRNRAVGTLSNGEQRLASSLLALAAEPDVLLLDEPAAGLDPIARRSLLAALVEAISSGRACTILLCTHVISDLERVVDEVGVMDRGRMAATARLDDLLQTTKRVQLIFDGALPPLDFAVPGALKSETVGSVITAIVRLADEHQLDPLRELPGVRVNVFPIGLEEIFVELYGVERHRDSDPSERWLAE